MQLADYDISHQYTVRVTDSRRVTPVNSDEIRELKLEILNDDFSFEVGQSIGVLIKGPHDLGHPLHFRLYTIADMPNPENNHIIEILVKRINYIDEYSGEKYAGIASNFLCDRKAGDRFVIAGPYHVPFQIPEDRTSPLLMIGMGTGIAPFRAFVKHIFENLGGWKGPVRLYYGARTGLECLYMNDEQDDFKNYYDEETFQAFKVIGDRPHWNEAIGLDEKILQHEKSIKTFLNNDSSHIFVAGHDKIQHILNHTFSKLCGSEKMWQQQKQKMLEQNRWHELIY